MPGGPTAAICQSGTTAALGGSFGGGATAAVWSDGGAGGTFANNGGLTPNTTTYAAAAGAPASITLTLTTSGGSCGTVFASKTITVNPKPTVNVGGCRYSYMQGKDHHRSFGWMHLAAEQQQQYGLMAGQAGHLQNNGGLTPNTTTYTASAGAQLQLP